MAQYSALRCVSGIWQNSEKPLISNGLGFIFTCLLTAALWVLFLFAGMTFATPSYSQTMRVTIVGNGMRTGKVINEIEKQTEYLFVYDVDEVDMKRNVNVNAQNQPVAEVLDKVFDGTGVYYAMEGKNIMLMKKNAQQQDNKVTGVVKDANGDPIIGANVTVKGESIGTITDIDGRFILNAPSDAVLQITYIGYVAQDVKIDNRKEVVVTLVEDTETLDEVVVVGYGTQKKVNLTGSVGNVSLDDLGNRPITNASNALQGTVSGVYALQRSGQPGSDGSVINIRGVGTLNNSDPLVLIDGFPGSMSDVDASDISSISVLKDAASAAIYGNRAANGVVLITTKKGATGKVKLSYNGYFGIQEATSLPDVLNSYEYATLYNEACRNSGQAEKYLPEEIQKFREGTDPMYPSINYFDVYYDKATMQNHRLNVSGGSDTFQYAFMLGYLEQDGILVGTNYRKTDFRANIDSYLWNKRLRVTARLSGNYGVKKEPTDTWAAKWYATNAPVWPLKNTDGIWMSVNGERNYYGEIMEGSRSRNERYVFNGQLEGELKIWDGLSAQFTYGYNVESANTNAFNANVTLASMDGTTKTLVSDLNETNNLNFQTLLTTLLRYNKTFGKHEISVLAGYSEEYFKWKWNSGFRSGFINNNQPVLNLGDASTMSNNADAYDLGLRSFFGRINYSFNNRYLFEANIRRDASSRFAEGNQWGTFPSFSVGWIVSEEDFMKDLDWLDMFKVRASWGKLGNQNINSYYVGSEILSSGQNYSLGGTLQPGVAVNSMINKGTTWETTSQFDIGFDLALNNGLSLTFDYFDKRTNDILMQTPIPLTMGNLSAPYVNAGKVSNKGIEALIGYRKNFENGLKLRTSLNLSHIVNKITDLNGASPIISEPKAQMEGYAINAFYGYEMDGLYQISDFTWQNNSDPNIPHEERDYVLKNGVVSVANYTAQPGDIKYKDLNGDGKVTMEDDRTIIGKQFPDLTYAWQLNLEWKNFDFSMFWQGVQGINGYTYFEIACPFSGFANMGSWWLDRWTPDNPDAKYPRLTLDGTRNNIHSTFYMENASYLRLKNIELGYTFDKKLLPFMRNCTVRLYGNIQNAFTITNYKGFDPEMEVGETRAQAYPQVRIYTIGLNVNF